MAIYYVNALGSNTAPFDTVEKAATNFYNLIASVGVINSDDKVYPTGTITEPDEYVLFEISGEVIGTDSLVDVINVNSCGFSGPGKYSDIGFYTDNISFEYGTVLYDPASVIHCRFNCNNIIGYPIYTFDDTVNIEYKGNVIDNCIETAFYIEQHRLSYGAEQTFDISNNTIRVNPAYSNPAVSISVRNINYTSLNIYNNVITGSTAEITTYGTAVELYHKNNLCDAGFVYTINDIAESADVTEITSDPLFLGIEPNPLAIDDTSPCYVNGVYNVNMVAVDILGTTFANPPSMGAYEIVSEYDQYYVLMSPITRTRELLASDGLWADVKIQLTEI